MKTCRELDSRSQNIVLWHGSVFILCDVRTGWIWVSHCWLLFQRWVQFLSLLIITDHLFMFIQHVFKYFNYFFELFKMCFFKLLAGTELVFNFMLFCQFAGQKFIQTVVFKPEWILNSLLLFFVPIIEDNDFEISKSSLFVEHLFFNTNQN